MTTETPLRLAHPHARRAFTLIELMVSVAMVLVIILGVNAIFKMASDTINAGQALSAADRENRAAQSVLFADFQAARVIDGPMLFIRSEQVAAFRNREDELADPDTFPLTADTDDDNIEGETGVAGELTYPLVYNSRNHRVDRVGFFASHLYRRQTGTDNAKVSRFIDTGSSNEAYVWIGHLAQPNGLAEPGMSGRVVHTMPGEASTTVKPNPNNRYATDFILGRSVTLLRDPVELPPVPGQPALIPPNYYPPITTERLSPLAPRTKAKEEDRVGTKDWFASSRYDVAQTTISGFRETLQNDILLNPDVRGTLGGTTTTPAWWELMAGWASTSPPPPPNQTKWDEARFQGYLYPDRPLTAFGVARTVPVFVRGCTHFTVEYAGDYLAQVRDTGRIVNTYLSGAQGVDGLVDFTPVLDAASGAVVHRVRWYGMPRNVDTRDDVGGPVITGAPGTNADNNNHFDVIPLRDLLNAAGVSTMPDNFFEHFNVDASRNYAAPPLTPNGVVPNYYAAWGPADLAAGSLARPKMLRITMTVDDATGRMSEGQTYEYVIDLP